jgi:hypothetical protein
VRAGSRIGSSAPRGTPDEEWSDLLPGRPTHQIRIGGPRTGRKSRTDLSTTLSRKANVASPRSSITEAGSSPASACISVRLNGQSCSKTGTGSQPVRRTAPSCSSWIWTNPARSWACETSWMTGAAIQPVRTTRSRKADENAERCCGFSMDPVERGSRGYPLGPSAVPCYRPVLGRSASAERPKNTLITAPRRGAARPDGHGSCPSGWLCWPPGWPPPAAPACVPTLRRCYHRPRRSW